MKTLFALGVLIVMAYACASAHACTAFMMTDGDTVLVGNNEDYNIPHTRVWFIPAEDRQYGRIYFGYENFAIQGGMNDQGLFFDFFATRPLEVRQSKAKPKFQGDIIDSMAAKCATVQEVLDLFEQYSLEFMLKFQMFVVDKTGNAAIVEGDNVIDKTGAYQIVTNFHQSKVKENRRPCEWYKPSCMQYKTAEEMLTDDGTVSVEFFRGILAATHRNTVSARTLYSNIYDLKKGLVYLYYLHNFDNEVGIDLNEELKKGRHFYILPSLFGKDLNYGHKAYVHPSPAFSIFYPKHFKVVEPKGNEVFRAKCSFSSIPLFSVYVGDKPQGIRLRDIGELHYADELKQFGTDVKLVSSTQTTLKDGTPANEMQFDWVTEDHWPAKTLILATYRGNKLISPTVTSLAHPEALKDFVYSLEFE